jgi:hypothetical protein
MRASRRHTLVLLAALAACAGTPLPKELPRCEAIRPGAPSDKVVFEFDEAEEIRTRRTDTNHDGIFDQVVHYEAGRASAAEVDRDLDGQPDLWIRYDAQGRETLWRWQSKEMAEPAETSDPEVARRALSGGFAPLPQPALADCLARADVRAYQERVHERLYSKWHWGSASRSGQFSTLRFALDARGALLHACVVRSSDPEIEKSAVRALYRAAPFAAMGESEACLSGTPLRAEFGTQ